jgi:phage-related holin
MNPILWFLWWCAGADGDLLADCRSQKEKHKYAAIGASVLLTTACAVLSGGYAFYTIFKNPTQSLLLGLFWGLFVFNMDRLILITTHKEEKISFQQIWMAIIRIVVALLIAVVVAKPLELKIFEKPILAYLAQENAQIAIVERQKLNEGMPEIVDLKAEIQRLEKDISDKETNRDSLCNESIKEAEGIGGTGKEGKGPVYAEKQAICLKQEEELKALRSQIEPLLAQNRQRISQLEAQKDEQFKTVTTARERADDLITQLNVMEKIAKNNPAIAHASHAISWLFIIIDTAPIFAKLLAKPGPYDVMLQQLEEEENLRVEGERKYFPNKLEEEQKLERNFYNESIKEAYASDEMKEVKKELSQNIVNRTRKKYVKNKKAKFSFFFNR